MLLLARNRKSATEIHLRREQRATAKQIRTGRISPGSSPRDFLFTREFLLQCPHVVGYVPTFFWREGFGVSRHWAVTARYHAEHMSVIDASKELAGEFRNPRKLAFHGRPASSFRTMTNAAVAIEQQLPLLH